jgi:hypothetical protein
MTRLNTILTAIGAIFATITGIFTGLNTLKLAELDVVVKQLDLRDRTQQISSDFADIFIKQVMPHSKVVNDEKNIQALLSILDIVAQASADDGGWSEAEARKLMPLNLALILGESGCVAALDPHYKYLKQWVGTAMSDNHPRTLATAVKALHGIGLRALREQNLPVVEECISSIEQLIKNIPPSPKLDEASPFLVAAISARAQLRQSLVSQEQVLKEIENSPDGSRRAAVQRIRQYATNSQQTDISTVLESKKKLEDQKLVLEAASQPDVKEIQAVSSALGSAEAAIKTASQNSVAEVIQPAAAGASPGISPTAIRSTEQQDDLVKKAAEDLIALVPNDDDQVRRKARADLGLLGQSAVGSIVEKLSSLGKSSTSDPENVYRIRLGLTLALKFMRQPIKLDADQVATVVDLLGAQADIRKAAADFLMDLWDGNTIRIAYKELDKDMQACLALTMPPDNAQLLQGYYAALIVGTWARNLVPSIPSDTPDSMRDFCLGKAAAWRGELSSSQMKKEWKKIIELLDELIVLAKKARSAAPGGLASAPAPVPPLTAQPLSPASQDDRQTSSPKATR